MNKLSSLIILSIIFFQLIGFTLAQDTIPTVPMPRDNETEEEIQQLRAESAHRMFVWNITFWIVVALSLILGFFITKKMVRKNPKITNWIIHIIMGLASLTVLLMTLIDGISCLNNQYCGFPTFYYFLWFATFFSVIFSISIIRGLVKKRTDKRYSTNMSSSIFFIWLILIILIMIAELIVRPNYDIPAFIILPFVSGILAFALYPILGLIGHFIDKSKNN